MDLKDVYSKYKITPPDPNDPRFKMFTCRIDPEHPCQMLVNACIKRQQILFQAIENLKNKIRRGMGHVSVATVQKRYESCMSCVEGQENMRKCGLDPLIATPEYPVSTFCSTGHGMDVEDLCESDERE